MNQKLIGIRLTGILLIIIGITGYFYLKSQEENQKLVNVTIIERLQNEQHKKEFDFTKREVTLNNEDEMLINGIGTDNLKWDTYYDAIASTLKFGVRLIDMYVNEETTELAFQKLDIEDIV